MGQSAIRQMFLRLVTLGEGVEDTRRRTPREELLAISSNIDVMEDVIDTYAAYRLLSLDHDPATRQPMVEVAHEAILREWESLRQWVDEARDEIRMQQQLAHMTEEWEQAQHELSFLAHGARLEQFEVWMSVTPLTLTPLEQQYLEASLAERKRQEEQEARRQAHEHALEKRSQTLLRGLVGVFALAALIGAALSVFAFSQSQQARDDRATSVAAQSDAQFQALIANARLASARGNGDFALALALEAYRNDPLSAEAQLFLSETAYAPGTRRFFSGHEASVLGLDVSPDGRYLLSGSGKALPWDVVSTDNTMRLWDIETGEELRRFEGHTDTVWSVAFSPDGRTALSGSVDGLIILWDIESGQEIRRYVDHRDAIYTLAISPDGKTFLSGGGFPTTNLGDTTIRHWDIQTGEVIQRFDSKSGIIFDLIFNPDGQTFFASGGNWITDGDPILEQWDIETGEILHAFEGHSNLVYTIALSADGQHLFSGANNPYVGNVDTTLRIWDVSTGQQLLQIAQGAGIESIALSPDNRTMAVGLLDGTIRLWDVATAREFLQLSGHSNVVQELRFASDGRSLVSASLDGTIRLWALGNGAELWEQQEHDGGLAGVAYGPPSPESNTPIIVSADSTGTLMLSSSDDGQVLDRSVTLQPMTDLVLSPDKQRLFVAHRIPNQHISVWDIRGTSLSQAYEFDGDGAGHTDWISDMDLNPDGTILLTVSPDRTLVFWDAASGDILKRLGGGDQGHTSAIYDGAFTLDGRSVISSSWDGTLIRWDIETGEPTQHYVGNSGQIWALALSPDGKHMMSGFADGSLTLWDIASGDILQRYFGHNALVDHVAFSPDGQQVISGSWDKTLILWDVQTGNILRRFTGHQDTVFEVAFAPDGKSVLSGGSDPSLRLWAVHDTDELLDWTCANRVIRALTPEERARFQLSESEPFCP